MDWNDRLERLRQRAAAGDVQATIGELESARRDALAENDGVLAALLTAELAPWLVSQGQAGQARAALETALAALPAAADPGLRARVLLELARANAGDHPEAALQFAAEADAQAATLADPVPRLHTLQRLVQLLVQQGHLAAAGQVADVLAAQARSVGDTVAELAARIIKAETLLAQDRAAEALDPAREAFFRAESAACPASLFVRAARARGVAALRLGRNLEAVEAMERARAVAGPRIDDEQLAEWAAAHLAFGDAPADIDAVLEHLAASADPRIAREACRAQFDRALALGRSDAGERCLKRLVQQEGEDSGAVRLARARLALRCGRPAEAQAAADAILAERPAAAAARLLRAEALWAAGAVGDAVAVLDALVTEPGLAADSEAPLRTRRAAMALALGDIETARRDARRAVQLAAELESGADEVAAHGVLARCHVVDDDLDGARAELQLALDMSARLGLLAVGAAAGVLLGRVAGVCGEGPEARHQLEVAAARADAAADVRMGILARIVWASLLAQAGDAAGAALRLGEARAVDERHRTGFGHLIDQAERGSALRPASA